MNFFNIDLHISIIADMKHIFTDLGHTVCDKSLSEHTWVFNRKKDSIPMLDNSRWMQLKPEQFSNEFYHSYKDQLGNKVDAFIVTYPPIFSLLYKHFNKPIIINNPIRYEWPFSFRKNDWEYFNEFLREGVDNNRIFLIANNIHDKRYMEAFIEREVEHIPSICDYYGLMHEQNNNLFIYYSRDKISEINNPIIKYKDDLFKSHTHNDLVEFKGIIHIPYQISYMSIFEQYTSNIPLFFPTREFLIELYAEKKYSVLKEVSWNNYCGEASKSYIKYNGKHDPNDYNNNESVMEWLKYADFYDEQWMPYITYFSSFQELNSIVNTVNVDKISNNMKVFNESRKSLIYKKWNTLLSKIK
jgi:hypothetical protein